MPCTSTTKRLEFVGDGRAKTLLKHVLTEAEKDNPQLSMSESVDLYCQRTWLICVGNEKGAILDSCVKNCKPGVVLELGAYCGYSVC